MKTDRMTREELRKEIDEIIDFSAEIYCQLGESGKERTRPMIAGIAYKNGIMSLIDQYVAEIIGQDEYTSWDEWIIATRLYGGTREEYSKLEDIWTQQNRLRAEMRKKASIRGGDSNE